MQADNGLYPQRRLRDLISLEYGDSLPNENRLGGHCPVLGSNGIVGYHDTPKVNGPGIVVGRKGSIGQVTWVAEDFWPIDTTYYVEQKTRHNRHWLYYLLEQLHLEKLNSATGVPGLNREDAYALSVPVPTEVQTRKIAEIIQAIDDAIEATQAVIKQARQLKTALLQDLLIKGIPGEETQFNNCRLGQLFSERKEHGQPGLPILSVTMDQGLVGRDTLDRRVVSKLKPEEHLLVRRGDIAYNMMRMWQGVFGLAWQDGIVSPAYVVLKPQPQINSHFASYLFEYPDTIRKFERFSQGLTGDRLRLYYDNFCSIPARIPDEETQSKIAATLQSVDERLLASENDWESLHQIKTALSQGLLTGRISVTGRGNTI